MLSNLFARPDASLILYSFMFAQGEAPCPMCTAFLDSLNGAALHARQRVNLAVVAKCDIRQLHQWRDQRGWHHLDLLSSAGNTYNADYYGEMPNGQQTPILNVFVQTPAGTRHHYATELFFAPPEAGQHPRHMDMVYPMWNLFDFVPEGRPSEGLPKLAY